MNDSTLKPLNQLIGKWVTESTHPMVPGVIVRGTGVIEWLEGERFLIHRSRTDHPDFPDAISIIGFTDQDRVDGNSAVHPAAPLTMHYFDSRGVFRVFTVSIDHTSWRILREAPGFSQRFVGTFADRGDTIIGQWQLREDDVHWKDDLRITFRRQM